MMKNHKENEGINAIKKRGKESPRHLSLKQKCLKLIEKSYKVDIEAHYKRFFIDAIVFKNGITIPVECGTVSKNKLMSLINDFNQVVWIPYNSEPVVLTRENFHQYIDKMGQSLAPYLKDEVVVSVILPREIYDILEKVTKDRGEVKSTFIRRLIYTELARLSYLDEDKKKALGVEQGENK